MSSETTELTFVRCPSCRSLVPATATRCRICNNPLDGGAKADDSEANRSAGRIRQKTMTASADDIANALGSANSSSSSTASSPSSDSVAEISSEVDPLGAYLQELEEAEEMGLGDASRPFKAASPQGSDDDSSDDLDPFALDLFDQLDEELEVAPVQPAPVEVHPTIRQAVSKVEVARAAAQPGASERAGETAARRPTGIPQSAKAGGLNGQARSEDHRVQDVAADRQARRDQPNRPTPSPERSADRGSSVSGPRKGKAQAGRLLGWLVSYENADGRAIELREGRFFITSNSIKENDLVIEDPSISTPHALMSVALQGGVKVQDLMSESGTHVRSGDEDSYRREEASVELKHGDWIRLGEVEFLVALVPQVRDRN